MNLLETIMAAQGGGALQGLAKNFGLGDSQASSALEALLPALSSGLKRNAGGQGKWAALLAGIGFHVRLERRMSLEPGGFADGLPSVSPGESALLREPSESQRGDLVMRRAGGARS